MFDQHVKQHEELKHRLHAERREAARLRDALRDALEQRAEVQS